MTKGIEPIMVAFDGECADALRAILHVIPLIGNINNRYLISIVGIEPTTVAFTVAYLWPHLHPYLYVTFLYSCMYEHIISNILSYFIIVSVHLKTSHVER